MDNKILVLARKLNSIEKELKELSKVKNVKDSLFINSELEKYRKFTDNVIETYESYIENIKKEFSKEVDEAKKYSNEVSNKNKLNKDEINNKIKQIKEDSTKVYKSIDNSITDIQNRLSKEITKQYEELIKNNNLKDKELSEIRKENKNLKTNINKLEKLINDLELQKGEAGKSAYEIACELGFKGTKEEWIKSLHGKDGKDIELRGMRAFSDAPKDGKTYARKNKKWVEVENPDSTDYVKNTDYATYNKGGVIKKGGYSFDLSNGFPIAQNVSYLNYLKAGVYDFIGKGTLENVIAGKQLINQTQLEESQETQDEEIEKLQEENARLKATLPTTTEEGKEVTLNKTAELEFIKPPLPMGNSEQESTTGKNLLPSTNSTETINGVTFTKNSDGSITANGTATDGINYYTNGLTYTNIPAGTYKLSDSVNSGESGTTYFTFLDGGPDNNSTVSNPTFTLTENTDLRARIVIRSGQTLNNIVFKPMLRLASITDDTYEPYTNGASPNPDYPQEITNVTGDVEVVVENKNLFDKNNANILRAYVIGTNIRESSVTRLLYIPCKSNTTYTISKILSARFRVATTDETPEFGTSTNNYVANDNGTSITITTSINAKYLCVFFYQTQYDTTLTYEQVINSIQIEKNPTPTTYTEHKSQILPLTLGNIELCKIGDYQDYFYKESNKWYLHKEIDKVVLNGSESWTRENYSSQYYYRLSTTIPNQITGFSNYYKVIPYSTGILNYTNSLRINNSNIDIVNDKSNVSLEDFKSWLSTHNTEVYYVLATPTDTEIIDTTLISQLEAINNAISYEEQTNISSNTIALFNVEAYQSTKLVLEENNAKYESLEARVALLE